MTDDAKTWEDRFVFGRFSHREVLEAVTDPNWQVMRRAMSATTLETKWALLENFLLSERGSRRAQICVTNYVYALKRGGLIKKRW
jgi:hypothetical protein